MTDHALFTKENICRILVAVHSSTVNLPEAAGTTATEKQRHKKYGENHHPVYLLASMLLDPYLMSIGELTSKGQPPMLKVTVEPIWTTKE